MKPKYIAAIILLLICAALIISGCSVASNLLPKRCPTDCTDKDVCTLDKCNKETNYTCIHDAIAPCDGNKICEAGEYLTSTDCPNCDDQNKCTTDRYSETKSECTHTYLPNCCGNAACDLNESFVSCPTDCPSCDDRNSCTRDIFSKATNMCEHIITVPCCGNGVCEPSESFSSCSQDCEANKQDHIKLCSGNETCFINVALKYKDVSLCKNALTTDGTDSCYSQMALSQNLSYLCSLISSEQKTHDCQEEYAIKALEPTKCPTVNPNNCFESIAIKTKQIGICGLMVEQFVHTLPDFVMKCKAVVNDDPLLCKQIEKAWIADKCYTQIAVTRKEPSLCEAVKLEKESCQFYVEQASSIY